MRYKINTQTLDIEKNTTLIPEEKYGGWMAVNTGTAVAEVMGYPLQPGEGLNFLDALQPGDVWDTPIKIIPGAGGKVRITRLQARPIEQ